MDSVTTTAMKMRGKVSPAVFRAAIYIVAFVTGAIVMSFEMLGSRYLNPYFGSGIYTWAGLISTVLAALTVGYFLGGFIADRTVSANVLGMIVGVASVYLLVLPSFADAILRFVLDTIDNVRLGSLYAATPMEFVVLVLERFFGMTRPEAQSQMLLIHHEGRAICGTYPAEEAEKKVADVLAFAGKHKHPLRCVLERKV